MYWFDRISNPLVYDLSEAHFNLLVYDKDKRKKILFWYKNEVYCVRMPSSHLFSEVSSSAAEGPLWGLID